jgi:mono/diheme cytochrome c family protein
LTGAAMNCRWHAGNPGQGFANSGLDKIGGGRDGWFTPMKKFALIAIPAAFALAVTITPAHAADGKTVYSDNCAKCHGDDGKGATKMGTKLGAKDYSDAKVQDALKDDQAFKSIKEGLKKDDKSLMKPSELTDEDIKASIAYLRTLKK